MRRLRDAAGGGWRERAALQGDLTALARIPPAALVNHPHGWAAFPGDPVTCWGRPLLVQDVVALPAVLRGWGALLRLAGQLDVVPNHGLSLDATVRLGGRHCMGEGPE